MIEAVCVVKRRQYKIRLTGWRRFVFFLHVNLETIVNLFVAEVFRHCFGTDVGNAGAAPNSPGIQFELSEIGREEKGAAGPESLQAAIDDVGMVSLNIQAVAHPFGIGKGRRIEYDDVKFFGGFAAQPGGHVGLDKPVLRAVQLIDFQVFLGPLEVGGRHVERSGGRCAAGCGIHGEGAGVGKEIEHTFALGCLANQFSGLPVVEEEAGV